MNIDLHQDEIVKLVKSRIINPENNYEKLIRLIEGAHLENSLLSISSFEKISFYIKNDQVDASFTPVIERLSLVHPPSFECIFPIRITGYYLVKYLTSSVELPIQLPAFTIEYFAILVLNKNTWNFKQEHIRLTQ